MKDQMQYIVIEGRKPQDGAKPAQALLILPKWISPTLACAGIVGRVIELTDGNVIEQGLLPGGEQDLLAEIRADMLENAESQQQEEEVSPTAIDPNAVQPADDHVKECPLCALPEPEHSLGCPNKAAINVSQLRDDAYREGMQATRARMRSSILQFGAPESGLLEWLREQLEELAQFRKDRPETLAKLQAAEDNLDAWRDAADVANLIQVCDTQTGRITALLVQDQASEVLAKSDESLARCNSLLRANNRYYELQRAIALVMAAGQDYIDKGGLAE